MMDLGLRDRVVLITGAGRGLGYSYARTLAREGAHVVVHDAGVDKDGLAPDSACANTIADELRHEGGSTFALTDLLSDAEACRRVVSATIERFGRLDGLIHNAGLVIWRDPADVDEELYRRLTGVNNDAAFWLCSAALPVMRDQGFGRIVLTSSGWALEPYRGSDELVLYSHGKGAQLGLAMALAKGAGHPGIFTNVITPVANTRIFAAEVPAGTLRPESVAGAVAWMASPACTLNGAIVGARNGELAVLRLETVAKTDLGDAASDPIAAGAALAEMSKVKT